MGVHSLTRAPGHGSHTCVELGSSSKRIPTPHPLIRSDWPSPRPRGQDARFAFDFERERYRPERQGRAAQEAPRWPLDRAPVGASTAPLAFSSRTNPPRAFSSPVAFSSSPSPAWVRRTWPPSGAPPHPTPHPHPPRTVTAMACTAAARRHHGRKGRPIPMSGCTRGNSQCPLTRAYC
jgi:hypothetical protein